LPAGSLTSNYPIFLFAGFLPWLLFQETATRSASCLVEQSNLITKTVFPSEILPVSIFLSSLIHHAIAVALVLVATVMVLGYASPGVLWLPLYMFLTGLFAVGVAWIVSSLQVYLRDTAQIFTVVMTLWFWITPVFLTAEQIPERFRWVVKLNPMAHLVNAYRARLLSAAWPDGRELAAIAAGAVTMFLIGGLFFRHLKRGFADVL
jgi:ABC-type polysaccharide/polyol phosphate export permease